MFLIILIYRYEIVGVSDEAKEESILHLRLEPVLLLRKPQRHSGRENKWWVVGKDYTEFDGTNWFHASFRVGSGQQR